MEIMRFPVSCAKDKIGTEKEPDANVHENFEIGDLSQLCGGFYHNLDLN